MHVVSKDCAVSCHTASDGVRPPAREGNNIPSYSAEVKNKCSASVFLCNCISVLHLCFFPSPIDTVQARTQNFFFGGGGGPGAIYNLCTILKIMLQKSCFMYNRTRPAAAVIYVRI
jgi:hypothetical protein